MRAAGTRRRGKRAAGVPEQGMTGAKKPPAAEGQVTKGRLPGSVRADG